MKTRILIITVLLFAFYGATTAQVKSETETNTTQTVKERPNFVDKDNNGVCDNFEKGTPRNPNANGKAALKDGSGRKTGKGMKMRMRRNANVKRDFVDENNNGVCDNFEKGTPRNPKATGKKDVRNYRNRNK